MYDNLRTPNPAKKRNRTRFLTVFFTLAVLMLVRQLTVLEPTSTVSGAEYSVGTHQLAETYLFVAASAPKPPVYAKNYALIDAVNGDLLVAQRADDLIPIASTTKMVTALTVVENMDLDQVATIGQRPPTVQGSKINLLPGEKITVRDLLKGLLINSGNDAAFALAETYGGQAGDYQAFIDQMNRLAKTHGLTKSVFFDPAGLDDEHGRSTARELAHIARLVLADKELYEIVMTPQTTITSVDGQLRHDLKNTNRLIQSDTPYYLPNALGVKTGFTNDAGHSLVSAYKLGERTVIGVVMNTAEYSNTASAAEMRKLFLWAEKYVSLKQYLH